MLRKNTGESMDKLQQSAKSSCLPAWRVLWWYILPSLKQSLFHQDSFRISNCVAEGFQKDSRSINVWGSFCSFVFLCSPEHCPKFHIYRMYLHVLVAQTQGCWPDQAGHINKHIKEKGIPAVHQARRALHCWGCHVSSSGNFSKLDAFSPEAVILKMP